MSTGSSRLVIHGQGLAALYNPDLEATSFGLQPVHSIAFLSSSTGTLTGLELNGKKHGAFDSDTSYSYSEELYFSDDEFINYIGLDLSDASKVKGCKISTNKGRSIESGLESGVQLHEYNDIRLIAISGVTSAVTVHQLGLEIIEDFKEPEDLPSVEEALAVIDVIPQFTKLQTISSSEIASFSAATRVIEEQFSASTSAEATASVSVGFKMAKATVSGSVGASFGSEATNSNEFQNEISQAIENTETYSQEVPEGYVGLQVIKVKLYEEFDGFRWMYPVSEPQYLTLAIDSDLLSDIYDLTGTLAVQLPAVADRIEEKNGFTYIA